MQAGGNRPEHRGPDAATRLRLLSLTTPGGPFEFGGGLACVHTRPDSRSAVAETIARAVIGPRPADIDGTLDIAGRFVALRSLPAPLLSPSAASTVDRSMLDELWRRARAQYRADLQAAHSARRLERHRTEAAIERAHDRAENFAARMAAIAPAPPPPEPEPEPEPEVIVTDEVTPRLETLVAWLGELLPVPSADALGLATAFEELAAAPPPPPPEPLDIDLPALEQRVAEGRVAVAQAAGGVLPAARTLIEQCHRVVVDTERTLFEADRKERPDVLAHYQEALGAERDALAEAGVDSYASFLLAIAAGSAPVDLEARLRAQLELGQAEAALRQAHEMLDATTKDVPGEQELDLRARAAQVLGRFPGVDPAAELRAHRVEHPDAADIRFALRRELDAIGVVPGPDLVATAMETIATRLATPAPAPIPPPRPEPAPPVLPVVDPADEEERRVLEAEMQSLLDERGAHDAALAAMENELENLDRQGGLPFSEQLDAETVTLAVATMLDCYRSAELLAGRLPVVLDGAFDDLGVLGSTVVANHLAAVDDVQVIVVTSDDDVADAFSIVGAATRVWPVDGNGVMQYDAPPMYEWEQQEASARTSPLEPAAPVETVAIVPMCDHHSTKVAAASCAQCARGACVDCLVYMPAEAELWCVTCAEGARTPKVPLLGNRGA